MGIGIRVRFFWFLTLHVLFGQSPPTNHHEPTWNLACACPHTTLTQTHAWYGQEAEEDQRKAGFDAIIYFWKVPPNLVFPLWYWSVPCGTAIQTSPQGPTWEFLHLWIQNVAECKKDCCFCRVKTHISIITWPKSHYFFSKKKWEGRVTIPQRSR